MVAQEVVFMAVASIVGAFFTGMVGIYMGSKWSAKNFERVADRQVKGTVDRLLESEHAELVKKILKQFNEFSNSSEGHELLENVNVFMKNLGGQVPELTGLLRTLAGKGLTISPSTSQEEMINLAEKPEKEVKR